MSRFFNKLCPVCRQHFNESDDVVVCPECGTPHHRACYNNLGTCGVESAHAEGFEWNGMLPDEQPEQPPESEQSAAAQEPSVFQTENTDPHHAEYPGGIGYTNTTDDGGVNNEVNGAPYDEMHGHPFAEFYSHMQELTSDETRGADGVSGKELSHFVGTSVLHYAQAFSAFRTGVHKNGTIQPVKLFLNFCAGFFKPVHQFYRRMDALAIAVLILEGIMLIPDVLLNYYPESALTLSMQSTLQSLLVVGTILSVGLTMLLCVFGDYLYYRFCVRRIKKIRQSYDDGKAEGYYEALTESGRPSKLRAVIGILAELVVFQLVLRLPGQFLM